VFLLVAVRVRGGGTRGKPCLRDALQLRAIPLVHRSPGAQPPAFGTWTRAHGAV